MNTHSWPTQGDKPWCEAQCSYDAAAGPARVCRMRELQTIRILFPSMAAAWWQIGKLWDLNWWNVLSVPDDELTQPHRCSCSDSMFQVEERCSAVEGIVFGGSRSGRSHTHTPHTHSRDWGKLVHPQTHGFQRSSLEKIQIHRSVTRWTMHNMNQDHLTTLCTWTFSAALSGWSVWVGAVDWRTRSPLTRHSPVLRRRESFQQVWGFNRVVQRVGE